MNLANFHLEVIFTIENLNPYIIGSASSKVVGSRTELDTNIPSNVNLNQSHFGCKLAPPYLILLANIKLEDTIDTIFEVNPARASRLTWYTRVTYPL